MIIKQGKAELVGFPASGLAIMNPHVELHDTGIVHVTGEFEVMTAHLINCEIIWETVEDPQERKKKFSLLPKPA